MTAREAQPDSPTSVKVQDTPLGRVAQSSVDAVARGGSPPQRPIRPSIEYASGDDDDKGDEDDDEDDDNILGQAPSTPHPFRRGHYARPSAASLLRVDGPPLASTAVCDLRRRVSDYDSGEGPGIGAGLVSTLRRFVTTVRVVVRRNEGLLLIAVAQLGFALINMCVKLLERDVQVPVWELIMIRMSMTWVGCYTYLRLSGDPHPFAGPPGVRGLLALRGFVGFFGLYTNYAALQYLSLADTSTLFFLSPFLVGILGFLILHEPYSRLEALVGLASLSGTVFIAKPTFLFPAAQTTEDMPGHTVTSEQRTFAICLVLLGCFTSASVSIIIRYIGSRASPLHSISYFCIYSVIVSSIYPLVFHAPPVFRLSTRFFALLLPIGVLGFCAQALTTRGLVLEKAGRGALATYTGLLFTLVIERIAFHKSPDGWSLLGAAIIIGGAVRVALEHKGAPLVPPATAGGGGAAEGTEMGRAGGGAAAAGPRLNGYDPLVRAEEGHGWKRNDAEGFAATQPSEGAALGWGRRAKERGQAATTSAVPASH
ncbi:hypothetical protein JCM3770_006585 [Rhodotorula araucariae]